LIFKRVNFSLIGAKKRGKRGELPAAVSRVDAAGASGPGRTGTLVENNTK